MISRGLLAAAAAAAAVVCAATSSEPAPLEAYGGLPAMDDVTISPDGGKIAFVAPVKGQQMVVVEAINPPAFVAGLNGTAQKVRRLDWADPGHLLVTKSVTGHADMVESARSEWWMVQSFDVDKKKSLPLLRDDGPRDVNSRIKTDGETMNVVVGPPQVRAIKGRATVFLTGISFVDNGGAPALFSVELDSGKGKLVEKSLSAAWSWIVDDRGVPLAEYGYNETRKNWSLRLKKSSGWTEVYGVEAPIDTPEVEGISPDGSALILYALENGRYSYRALSLKDGALGPPLDAYASFLRLLEDPVTHRIIGGVNLGANADYKFFDPKDQAAWDGVLAAFPGEEVELTSWSDDRSQIVVLVTGPTHGVAYILVDMKAHKATTIGDAYAGIKPDDVAAVEAIEYKAADGRKIPAYLTLPNGREAKGLPLVVLPHGGPAALDPPGFDWWAQALASKGYAVLQPQFRGSTGLGWEFMSAGFGEFGRKMQTDLSDGVRALAKDGMIDPKRVCIVGGSYGGYAALAGATLDPGVYRCAVSVAGLSDLRRFLSWSGDRQSESNSQLLRYWDRFMGADKPDAPVLEQISPAKHVDKVAIPILLIHGKDDTVVPIEQSQRMADALTKAGKSVQFVTLPGEDHWLSRSETRLEMLQATVKFLETNNPPG